MRHPKYLKMRDIALAVLPAYLGPAVMVSAQALAIGDARLLRASYTTIAASSALGAFLVAIATHRGAVRQERRAPNRAFLGAAFTCAAVALVVAFPLLLAGFANGRLLVELVPSAALGGGITAWIHARRGSRRPGERAGTGQNHETSALPDRGKPGAGMVITLGVVFLMSGSSPGCAVPKPPSLSPSLSKVPPGDVAGPVWATFADIAATCELWEQTATAEAASSLSRQRRLGIASTIAGTLAIGAGVTGGVLSANEDDSDKALTIATIGGVGASVFGLLATASGLWASRQAGPAADADDVARGIARSVSKHSVAALYGHDAANRTEQVEKHGVELVRACARHARRLEVLHDLPVPATASKEIQRIAAIARSADSASPAATKAALYPRARTVQP